MKKQVTLFAGVALATLAVTQTPILAAQTSDYKSTGTVTFQPSKDTTNPVDPTNPNPDKPVKPTNPDGTDPQAPQAGPLSIDFASSIDFGIQKITSKTENYQGSAQQYTTFDGKKTTGPDYVQMTDNRGSFTGWTLSVKQNGQFKGQNSNAVLDGAEVTFGNANHLGMTTASTNATDITALKSFTLDPLSGNAINIMSGAAVKNAGDTNETGGTHLMRFGNETDIVSTEVNADGSKRGDTDKAVTLMVPGKTDKMADKYATEFEWILSDMPTIVK
ncbi:WxL domain-containing protein [Weissella confusa]|uniref:WxL domain-containing protein n=1 Tax=Weissella confusa TaxID=1583 RepID=A0AAJ2YX57_WEICO|nr:WxL domain-containing protein [Weissella confusa]MBJ7693813.1 WxL domain-containing protein [Weissella confusa]NBA11067.1 WxL domain-containing protein [Weissella confusa]QBZ05521.1 WxL domain-containing protein [Weissella confusa]